MKGWRGYLGGAQPVEEYKLALTGSSNEEFEFGS